MKNKAKEDREREFMIGLTELTRKTGIVIGGCGCCGSPWLQDADANTALEDQRSGYGYGFQESVSWISPLDKYDWERYADSIVSTSKEQPNKSKEG